VPSKLLLCLGHDVHWQHFLHVRHRLHWHLRFLGHGMRQQLPDFELAGRGPVHELRPLHGRELLQRLPMSAGAGHRGRLWLVLLAVAVGIIVTLAIVLGGKPDAPGDQAMQQTSDGTGSALSLGSGRSVPKLLLRRPPVEPVAAPVPPEQTPEKVLALPVTAPVQAKDQQFPADAAASSNVVHDLAQRMRDMAGRLRRMKAAAGSGGSGP
jgi:hypothetical protein